jgi:hypothetical protein
MITLISLLILTVLATALLFGGICNELHRGNAEMGVADTQGRDTDADGYLEAHDIGWDRGSAKTIAAQGLKL